jgi:hypothetical protein
MQRCSERTWLQDRKSLASALVWALVISGCAAHGTNEPPAPSEEAALNATIDGAAQLAADCTSVVLRLRAVPEKHVAFLVMGTPCL